MRLTKLIKQIPAFLCLVILSGRPTAGAPRGFPPTTCSVTILGTSGNLFCNFGEDIRETKHDFQVQRYDLNSADEDPDRVLVCYWKYPANLTCKVSDNYTFSGHVSDEAVIEIPKVTKDTEGRYGCQIIPPDAEMRLCTVSLSEGRPVPSLTESTSGRPTQPAPSNVEKAVPSNAHQCEQASSPVCLTLLGVIVAVVAVLGHLAGIAVGLVLSCRYELHEKAKDFISYVIRHQSKKQNGNEKRKSEGEKPDNDNQILAPPAVTNCCEQETYIHCHQASSTGMVTVPLL